MPVSWTTLFRLLVMVLVALHVFNMYCFSRVVEESVGLDAAAIVGSGFFALAMLIPLVWAVVLPDVPETIDFWVDRCFEALARFGDPVSLLCVKARVVSVSVFDSVIGFSHAIQ